MSVSLERSPGGIALITEIIVSVKLNRSMRKSIGRVSTQ